MKRVAAVAAIVVALLAPAHLARAATPAVTVDRSDVSIGQTVSVAVTGFPTGRAVSVMLCGNEARRGSVDCDLPGSVAFPIRPIDNVHVVAFPIGTPPVPCPCVVKVTNTPGRDAAITPLTINGFPMAPVVGNDVEQPLRLDVRVTRASQNVFGWLRSSLGGPKPYELRVVVTNRSTHEVSGIRMRARAGRSDVDQSRHVEIPVPTALAAGETWRYDKRVTLSAPVVGDFHWTVTASGDGALARVATTTDHQPFGLYVLGVALLGDLAWIVARRVRHSQRRVTDRRAPSPADVPAVLDLRHAPPVLDLRSDRTRRAESLLRRPIERDA